MASRTKTELILPNRLFAAVFVGLVLLVNMGAVGCGARQDSMPRAQAKTAMVGDSSSRYSDVLVRDFADRTASSTATVADNAPIRFADEIARVLRSKGISASRDERPTPSANTLVITGRIHRYDQGDYALGRGIQIGIGRARFEAEAFLLDGETEKVIDTIWVGEGGWFGGIVIEGARDVEAHMARIAGEIADRASDEVTSLGDGARAIPRRAYRYADVRESK